jgi:hypothetical protein
LQRQYRPFLHVLRGGEEQPPREDARHVHVVVAERAGAAALNVQYDYGHPTGATESGTTLRVYCEREDGTYRLAKQESDVRQILLDRPLGRRVRVSVTPKDGTSAGPEYFSEPVDLGQWR